MTQKMSRVVSQDLQPCKRACGPDVSRIKEQVCAVAMTALTAWLQKHEVIFFLKHAKEAGYPEFSAPPDAPVSTPPLHLAPGLRTSVPVHSCHTPPTLPQHCIQRF